MRGGGIILYPTETFYAIGCLANDQEAARAIAEIKRRADDKPMPIVARSVEQGALAVNMNCCPSLLMENFWPGPLTILLPALPGVAENLRNSRDMAAIRVSAGKLARALAKCANWPLAASSANISGRPPASKMEELDPSLLERLEHCGLEYGILEGGKGDSGAFAAPSTIIETAGAISEKKLRILREGAISRGSLERVGFTIID